MSSHHGKLLELLAIENKSNYHFLRIKLSFPEDMEILWKIDEYTADNLKLIAKFDEKYKYRLSLKGSWDDIKKEYISAITRTYLDRSERVYFPCSQSYVTQLSSIKSSHRIHDLDMQSFTPAPLEQLEQLGIPPLPRRPKKRLIFLYILLVIICFLLSTLLGYSILRMI